MYVPLSDETEQKSGKCHVYVSSIDMTHKIKHLHSISCSPCIIMLIQKINRHDCHEEFAEDNGGWKMLINVHTLPRGGVRLISTLLQ